MTPNTSFSSSVVPGSPFSNRVPVQQLSEKAKGKRPMMLFTANPANRESLNPPPPRESPTPSAVVGVPPNWPPLDRAFIYDERNGEFYPKPPTPRAESRPALDSRWKETGFVPDSQEDSDYALTQTQKTPPGSVTPARPLPVYSETVRTEKIVTKTVYSSKPRPHHGRTVCIQTTFGIKSFVLTPDRILFTPLARMTKMPTFQYSKQVLQHRPGPRAKARARRSPNPPRLSLSPSPLVNRVHPRHHRPPRLTPNPQPPLQLEEEEMGLRRLLQLQAPVSAASNPHSHPRAASNPHSPNIQANRSIRCLHGRQPNQA